MPPAPIPTPPPDAVRCRPVQFSVTPGDLEYLDRRARDAKAAGDRNASRSGELRRALREARKLRHDVRGSVHAVALWARLCRSGMVSLADVAEALDQVGAGPGELAEEG